MYFAVFHVVCLLASIAQKPIEISTPATRGVSPKVSSGNRDSGRYRCVWLSESKIEVYIKEMHSGTLNSTLTTLGTEGMVTDVQIATSSNDDYVLTWRADPPTDGVISITLLNTTGVYKPRFPFDTQSWSLASQLVVYLTSNDFVILWLDIPLGSSSYGNIYAQLFKADGSTSGPKVRLNLNNVGLLAKEMSAAALTSGGYVVTWVQERSTDSDVYAAIYSDDGSRKGDGIGVTNTAFQFSKTAGSPVVVSFPAMEQYPSGGFLIFWRTWLTGSPDTYESRGGYMRIFDNSGFKFGTEDIQVNQGFVTQFAFAPNLGFIATWVEWGEEVFGLEFDSVGMTRDMPFSVTDSDSSGPPPQNVSIVGWDWGYSVVWLQAPSAAAQKSIFEVSYYPPFVTMPPGTSFTIAPTDSPAAASTLDPFPENQTGSPEINSKSPVTSEPTHAPVSTDTHAPKEIIDGKDSTGSVVLYSALCLSFVCIVSIVILRKCKSKSNSKSKIDKTTRELIIPLQDTTTVELEPLHEISWNFSDFKEIGRGIHGVVWAAVNNVTREQMAIKESHHEGEALRREVGVLCSLRQKNILNYYGWSRNKGKLYMITEYCVGGRLFDYDWANRTTMTLAVADIACALSYLETRSLVHMDVAARNVLVMKDGTLKLSDMGLLTPVGKVIKSSRLPVPWCTPITIQKQVAFTSQDIWSFGCLVYETLSGTPPFHQIAKTEGLRQVARSIIAGQLPSLPSGLNDLELNIWNTVVLRCWDLTSNQITFTEILLAMEKMKGKRTVVNGPPVDPDAQKMYGILNLNEAINYETVDALFKLDDSQVPLS